MSRRARLRLWPAPGTKHFRIVFLPDEKTLATAYARLAISCGNVTSRSAGSSFAVRSSLFILHSSLFAQRKCERRTANRACRVLHNAVYRSILHPWNPSSKAPFPFCALTPRSRSVVDRGLWLQGNFSRPHPRPTRGFSVARPTFTSRHG